MPYGSCPPGPRGELSVSVEGLGKCYLGNDSGLETSQTAPGNYPRSYE